MYYSASLVLSFPVYSMLPAILLFCYFCTNNAGGLISLSLFETKQIFMQVTFKLQYNYKIYIYTHYNMKSSIIVLVQLQLEHITI
jgi:hypothetical protein